MAQKAVASQGAGDTAAKRGWAGQGNQGSWTAGDRWIENEGAEQAAFCAAGRGVASVGQVPSGACLVELVIVLIDVDGDRRAQSAARVQHQRSRIDLVARVDVAEVEFEGASKFGIVVGVAD